MNGWDMATWCITALAFSVGSAAASQTPQPGLLAANVKAAFPRHRSVARHDGPADAPWMVAAPPWRLTLPPDRRQILFRAGRVRIVSRYRMHLRHFEQDTQAGLFTIDMTRTRYPGENGRAGASGVKFAAWSADAGYLLTVSRNDVLRLGVAVVTEKRGSPVTMINPRWIRSTTRTIGIQWRHEGDADVALGQFRIQASRTAMPIERDAALATGAPIAEQGYYGSVQLPIGPSTPRAGCAIRLALTQARLAKADALALGGVSPSDRRATLALAVRF